MMGAGRRVREALIALLLVAILGGALIVVVARGQRLVRTAMPAVTLPSLRSPP